jgi:hypothetical protein
LKLRAARRRIPSTYRFRLVSLSAADGSPAEAVREHQRTHESGNGEEKDGARQLVTVMRETPPRSGQYQPYYKETCAKCGDDFFIPVGGYRQSPPYGCSKP